MRTGSAARGRRLLLVLLASTLAAGRALAPGAPPASASGLHRVDAWVLQQVHQQGSSTYWALLRQHADLSAALSIKDWNARGWYVYNRLTSVANSSQRDLRALLASGHASFKSFWIINGIRITSDAATLAAVAARPEVAEVLPDWSARIPPDWPARRQRVAAVEWNIMRINAPQVWSMYNDRGEGVTVANIDTGVQWDHPALIKQYRGLFGTASTVVNHNYNWFDPSHVCPRPEPCDNVAHGTHTMGIMVGDDRGSNQIGVAPRAHWIAAKGCETNGCSSSALLASGQWVLAPTDLNNQNPKPSLRPQAVNNSWGAANPSDPFYRSTVQAWVASGIFPAFSSGSQGPGCATMGAPASYPESYAMGAFDINNDIASFSSRGPSPFGGITKPNIAAPGVAVRSSVPTNSYAIYSGTSMATPHAAGTVALIWSAAPQWRGNVAATRGFLDSTAIDVSDLSCGGTPGNNNVWGEGRLDAFAAVTKAKAIAP